MKKLLILFVSGVDVGLSLVVWGLEEEAEKDKQALRETFFARMTAVSFS